jgi:hypothetical protein
MRRRARGLTIVPDRADALSRKRNRAPLPRHPLQRHFHHPHVNFTAHCSPAGTNSCDSHGRYGSSASQLALHESGGYQPFVCATLQWKRQQSVILAVNELILTAFVEHCITLPLIKSVKVLLLRVKSNIFWTILNAQNMKDTPRDLT